MMAILDILKEFLAKIYDTKDLSEVKTIIGSQISRDIVMGTMKIDQSLACSNKASCTLTNKQALKLPSLCVLQIQASEPVLPQNMLIMKTKLLDG